MSPAIHDDGKIISSSTQGNNSHNSSNCQHKWILGGDDCQEIDSGEVKFRLHGCFQGTNIFAKTMKS